MNPLICPECGELDEAPGPGPSGEGLHCRFCGHVRPFLRAPLLCVTGPSGTGKSTVGRLLIEALADRFVVLEQDVLWVEGLRDDSPDHRPFRSTWLRTAAMVQQNGRPVVLFGTVVPPEFEPLPERVLFSRIHYLALTCDPDVLADRLRARPSWREWDEERIEEMLEYAQWVSETAAEMHPPVDLLDTSSSPPEETAKAVRAWVEQAAHGI
ncbi:AAA family ATPase [Nocardiopsis halophila]|uniref:AAA family ATPase n=1 Tax=Nocardiopsis halophila TaxID=141692 RepID=UPI0004772C98|nr:AAA family ATPase [Nocardiopsis halophila]